MSSSSHFYPGSYLDAPTSSRQTPTTLPLETKVREEETTHGPNAPSIDFVLPSEFAQPSQQDPQPSQSSQPPSGILANRFPQSHYLHSQILGVPFTLSSTGQTDYDTSFSSDDFEQGDFWMVDATSGDRRQLIRLGKVGKALKKLFLASDTSVARVYTAGMRGLSNATDRPAQFLFGEEASTIFNIGLDNRKSSLDLGIHFDRYRLDSLTFRTEYALFDRDDEQGELALGIFFTHKCGNRKNIVTHLPSYR